MAASLMLAAMPSSVPLPLDMVTLLVVPLLVKLPPVQVPKQSLKCQYHRLVRRCEVGRPDLGCGKTGYGDIMRKGAGIVRVGDRAVTAVPLPSTLMPLMPSYRAILF